MFKFHGITLTKEQFYFVTRSALHAGIPFTRKNVFLLKFLFINQVPLS